MVWLRKLALLVLACLLTSIKCDEPHCSKYDFEEKVLEKLVRMEFNMEKTKLEIEEAIVAIENFKKEVEQTVDSVDKKLNALKEKMDELEKHTNEVDRKLTDTDTALRSELNNITESPRRQSVVFKARSNADMKATAGQTIVLPVVMINIGTGYDASTGVFTAPVNGTYLFTAAFCIHSGYSLIFSIVVDGAKQSMTLFYGDSNHSCHSADTVAALTTNQKVWLLVEAASSGNIIKYYPDSRWNTFSGVLVNV